MEKKDYLFREAIELFKVVDTCLSSFYNGQYHMYRPLAAQLRILFCDFQRKKNNALISKLFINLLLPALQEAQYYDIGSPEHLNGPAKHLWANPIDVTQKPKITSMPFEITQFANGLEICDILLKEPQNPIPLNEWLEQPITKFPINVSVVNLIRTVADRGGGAHIHPTTDNFLNRLKASNPSKVGYDALFTIAIGRFAQQVGYMVFQFYEKLGTKGKIDELMKIFDQDHPNIKISAKVPIELLKQQHSKLNLQSFVNAKQIWIDKV